VLGHFRHAVSPQGGLALLFFSPYFLPGIIAFSLPKKPILPAYFWPPFVLGLFVFYSQDASWRTGAELCLLLGIAIPLFKELTFRPVTLISNRIATYSYGIYLTQSFCIWVGLKYHRSWIIFILMMVIVPIVLYHAVEHPAIKLGRKLASASRVQITSVPAEVQT
jgi:peptidoglycan/LPS O-acetylase OafA/YrhL